MDKYSEMVFDDVARIEIPVRVGKTKYILREADADQVRQWKNANVRSAKMVDGKFVSVGDVADSELLLVSMCLTELCVGGEELRQVPITVLRSWPAKIVSQLYDRASEISGLKEVDTEETLTKRIAELTGKLEFLRAGRESDPAKN